MSESPPKIVFIEHSGRVHEVRATPGKSVMEAATANMVPGIIAECGGCCSCATCHVYVDAAWLGKLVPPDAMEQGMLEGALSVESNSRLSCQIEMTQALDGLTVRIPESQF